MLPTAEVAMLVAEPGRAQSAHESTRLAHWPACGQILGPAYHANNLPCELVLQDFPESSRPPKFEYLYSSHLNFYDTMQVYESFDYNTDYRHF